ncbi:hypothetical protein N186_02485 [Thermofilum adornatum]|uniref:Uncharacterized protein n=1 Tax=Thermofilum adornatum TaxID=1365176 RepID=S5ZCZ5_9CREN|nr:hypothetical protein N186_02485 [Thermofilum adornatum]
MCIVFLLAFDDEFALDVFGHFLIGNMWQSVRYGLGEDVAVFLFLLE